MLVLSEQIVGLMLELADHCCISGLTGHSLGLQNWEKNNDISDYAVSYCCSKAFIHWSNRGKESKTGHENNLKGMSLLIFGDQDKASRVLSFRQPLASERPHLMKEE